MSLCNNCGRKKRSQKYPLCSKCYFDYVFPVWEGHTEEDKMKMVIFFRKWIKKMEEQRLCFDLFDINDIITFHYMIFHADDVGSTLSTKQQYGKMFKDIKRFVNNYDGVY